METETPFQRRQRSPMHFWSRAENARAAGLYLWNGAKEQPALLEAYHREGALALELIIKAVIAQRIENGLDQERKYPPTNHNLDDLWNIAKLPSLEKGDRGRLIDAEYVLKWSGRYAVPKKEDHYLEEKRKKKPHRQVLQKFGKLELQRNWSFEFEDFDRIYRTAEGVLNSITPYIDEEGNLILPNAH